MHEDSNLETKQPTHDTTDSDGSLPRSTDSLARDGTGKKTNRLERRLSIFSWLHLFSRRGARNPLEGTCGRRELGENSSVYYQRCQNSKVYLKRKKDTKRSLPAQYYMRHPFTPEYYGPPSQCMLFLIFQPSGGM